MAIGKQSRRRFITGIAGAAAALSGGLGCPPPRKKPLVVLGEDFANIQAMERLKGAAEARIGLPIAFERDGFDIFNEKAMNEFGAKGKTYDVILHYSTFLSLANGNSLPVSEYKAHKAAEPYDVKELEADLFTEAWADASQYSARLDSPPVYLGYPFAANTMVLVYNQEMFREGEADFGKRNKGAKLSAPRTWEEFREIAKFFTNPTKQEFGIVMQGAANFPLYWEWCNFAFGQGGGVMDKKFGWQADRGIPLTLSSAKTIAATKFWLSMRPYNVGNFFSTGQAEQQERMAGSKVAMAIMWSDSLFPLVKSKPGRFGFAPIPGSVSMIGAGTYFINRRSDRLEAAIAYVLESLQVDTQLKLAAEGLCSPRRSVYEHPSLSGLPYLTAVKESLQRGRYMLEAGPDSKLVVDTIEECLQRIWADKVTVDAGLSEAQAKIESERPKYF